MEADWRVCRPSDGPRYFFHLPSQQVLWTLPPGIDEAFVPLFTDEDEQYVEEDKLETEAAVEEPLRNEDVSVESLTPEAPVEVEAVEPGTCTADTSIKLTPSSFIRASLDLDGSDFPAAWVRCAELSAGVATLHPSPLLLHPGTYLNIDTLPYQQNTHISNMQVLLLVIPCLMP
jgi:hypothetical protein